MWEYRTEKYPTDFRTFGGTEFDASGMNAHMNQLGSVGWELVSLCDISKVKGGSKYVIAVFKRPKPHGIGTG